MRIQLCKCLPTILVTILSSQAVAQERITLQEILPALEGSELGSLEVGDAPPPGSSRTVLRSEIEAALRAANRSSHGLALPLRVRIQRQARVLGESEVRSLAERALTEALAPCTVDDLHVPDSVAIGTGELEVTTNARRPLSGDHVSAVVVFQSQGRVRRVPVRASIVCPGPDVLTGGSVAIIAIVGSVRASVPGEARQPGRVGDVITVTNRVTRRTMRARVVDAQTVEIGL